MTTSEHPIEPAPELDTESPAEVVADPGKDAYRSLRALFQVVLFSMLILTSSLFMYLLPQVSSTRRQVNELTQFVANNEKNNVPRMRQFRDKLIEFAKSSPGYVPILSRYVNPTNFTSSGRVTNAFGAAVAPARTPVLPTK